MKPLNHKRCLEKIVHNLSHIDENQDQLEWIFSEGIWYSNNSHHDMQCMPDIIAMFFDHSYLVAEVKASYKAKSHAMVQIFNGIKWISRNCKYNPTNVRKKLVIYGGDTIESYLLK